MNELDQKITQLIKDLEIKQKRALSHLRKEIGKVKFYGPLQQFAGIGQYFSQIANQIEQTIQETNEDLRKELLKKDGKISEETLAQIRALKNNPDLPNDIKAVFDQLENIIIERNGK